MFENIPAELKEYPQWVVWKLEHREGAEKPTKIPYTPSNGRHADVTNPVTWGTYVEAVEAHKNSWGQLNGIGFVLTDNDPYTFIDLDAPKGTQLTIAAAYQRQKKIYKEFNSYSERSPSGNGLHIIVRGRVLAGRRRGDVEMYSAGRYMTMTGDVFESASVIRERQELVDILWGELGAGRNDATHGSHIPSDTPESGTDDEIVRVASSAANGEKFQALWTGVWAGLYVSQSEADYALVDILAFYTQNREQITRLFLASALGQRDKATKNRQYIPKMIEKAFDRILPPINIEALRAVLEAKRVEATEIREAIPQVATPPSTNIYSVPPGLVGEIAQFVYESAPRPVAEIALVAALGLMSGICGRAYNYNGLGLNQYILLLAATGTGKESINSGTEKLMRLVCQTVPAAQEFIGPAEIASPQALIKYLSHTSKSFVSIVGEFGLRLQQMTAANAGPNEIGLRRILLDLYNKSGNANSLRPTIYSQRENNTATVHAPAFSMVAESTPERFYQSLNESMVSEGFLPRFALVEYHGERPPLNPVHQHALPAPRLLEAMAALTSHSLMMNQSNSFTPVTATPQAQKLMAELDTFCDSKIHGSREIVRQLWSRTHVKALKLAAIVAVGVNTYHPQVNEDIALWAIRIAVADAENMLSRFSSGLFGGATSEGKQVDDVIRIVADYIEQDAETAAKYGALAPMHYDKVVPYSYMQRRLASTASMREDRLGATNAIKRCIQILVDRGELLLLSKVVLQQKYMTTCVAYAITDPRVFIRNKKKQITG
jgi:hypothetical protein